ncbi:hypothetical protein [Pajaroellobacter abortibovis]|uniref:Uncharacterized protein n=1 Tax=Pajaroellobacter abortibovis TaxID=1882918 RepID=A0A1L6MWH2_9BACT|nr:hypothetical protein [Pajaroellobacter abortibovis]APR99909.1 hypothetical protein BCY86_03850 [Pajaroellobacter abortibovis]
MGGREIGYDSLTREEELKLLLEEFSLGSKKGGIEDSTEGRWYQIDFELGLTEKHHKFVGEVWRTVKLGGAIESTEMNMESDVIIVFHLFSAKDDGEAKSMVSGFFQQVQTKIWRESRSTNFQSR